MYSKLLLLLAALIATTAWLGCNDEEPYDPPGPCHNCIGSIQIVTGAVNDTLYFPPNDSASTTVTVIVTDSRGLAYPSVPVDISLANLNLGFIEFLDPALRDTTNSLGRVRMIYSSFAQEGTQIITASAQGVTATRTLVIQQSPPAPASITLTATPTLLVLDSNGFAQSRIDFTIRGADNRGIPNITAFFSATGGAINAAPVTDSSGHTSFYWSFDNMTGEYWLIARAGTLRDSVQVEVRWPDEPPHLTVHLSWPADTVWFEPGDSVLFPFVAQVWNESGARVPGVKVNFTVENVLLGSINFLNQQLWDTTDAIGQVGLEFQSFGLQGDEIITACVGDSCDYMHFALREIQHQPPLINVFTIPATVRVDSNTIGDAFILVVARDENGILLPGITPVLTVEAGEFDPPPPTDANGESQTSWRFFNEFGAFAVSATIEYNHATATDSAVINVLYGP